MKFGKIKFMSVIGAIFILLSVATITPVVANQQTSAATTNIESETAKPAILNLPDEEKYKITSIMSKYTKKTNDGLLKITINDMSDIPLSKKEIQLYEKGLEKLNELVSEGKIAIVKDGDGEYIGLPTEKIMNITIPKTYSGYVKWIQSLNLSPSQKKSLLNITENEWNNIAEKVATLNGAGGRGGGKNDFKIYWHWWGIEYKIWLNHYWTQFVISNSGEFWLIVAILVALFGDPIAGVVVAIVAYICQDYFIESMRNHDHGNGVIIKLWDYWWTPWNPIDGGRVYSQ
ncbi:MAG: hypothetical protein J7K61_05785 [Thermoplasmata archaeon]|nr:hypothetical protein [Thermoplasmata archaeon]